MRPYHINAEGVANGKAWIDLDHIQMISDVVVDNRTEFGTATASFYVVLAFRENGISFSVYGERRYNSDKSNAFANVFDNHPLTETDIAKINQVHDQLVAAWQNKPKAGTNSTGPC